MRSDREELSAGEVARTVAPYQNIRAHRPDTQWLGARLRRSASMGFGKTTPILRIFDEAKAREFYVDFLGFRVD
jgi:hypothetical protein